MKKSFLVAAVILTSLPCALGCTNFAGNYVDSADPIIALEVTQNACESLTLTTTNLASGEQQVATHILDGKFYDAGNGSDERYRWEEERVFFGAYANYWHTEGYLSITPEGDFWDDSMYYPYAGNNPGIYVGKLWRRQ